MPSFREYRARVVALANDAKRRDHIHGLAVAACRPKSEASFYPVELLELSTIITHQRVFNDSRTGKLAHGDIGSRAPVGMPDPERARQIMARGMPLGELTNRYGESVRPFFASEAQAPDRPR
jgi:hypothetical protein